VRYTIRHNFETDIETFWSKVFFDPEYNRSLYLDYLGFTTFQILEDRTDPDGKRHRRLEVVPKVQLPAAARKLFGDSAGYTEVGTFDPATGRYQAELIANVSADKIKTTLELWLEPRGEKLCERVANIDNRVKIFGLGTLLEGFVEQQTRDQFSRGTEFTNRWIKEHGL
jgi:hypothetical protein